MPTWYTKQQADTLLAGKATPAQVASAIDALLAGAPGALNTLKELADAINDDANYAATVTAALNARPTAVQVAATTLSLVQAVKTPDTLITGAITRDANGVIQTAAVRWPDGTAGTFTTTSVDASGAINGYSITYGSPATKTYTQPTITRDANGAATSVPQITVA